MPGPGKRGFDINKAIRLAEAQLEESEAAREAECETLMLELLDVELLCDDAWTQADEQQDQLLQARETMEAGHQQVVPEHRTRKAPALTCTAVLGCDLPCDATLCSPGRARAGGARVGGDARGDGGGQAQEAGRGALP
jgi:hypothetical protein